MRWSITFHPIRLRTTTTRFTMIEWALNAAYNGSNWRRDMITGIQHLSYTVSDIEKARSFFVDTLGLKSTEVRDVSGERVEKIIGFDKLHMKIANITTPDNGNIELIQYVSPKGKRLDLATCNTGVAHLAFTVDSIDKVYKEWSARGVQFIHEPLWSAGGALKGWGIAYFRGPDGITMEVMEAPRGVKLHPATGFPIED
jgi:lactoylglutathione lyase